MYIHVHVYVYVFITMKHAKLELYVKFKRFNPTIRMINTLCMCNDMILYIL